MPQMIPESSVLMTTRWDPPTVLCRGRGAHSGPYEGFASGRWLEMEMRSEVDDLAHHVDRCAWIEGGLAHHVGSCGLSQGT